MATGALRRARSAALYSLLAAVTAVGRRLPLRASRAIGRFFGGLGWFVLRYERGKALSNLAMAMPELDDRERGRIVREMFRHLGVCVGELIWLPNVNAANRHETTTVEGFDRLAEIMDSGRGIVIFTAHCGNWEWLAYVTGLFGHPVSVLQRERDDPAMNRYITAVRAAGGVRTIDRGSSSSARDMINAIRRGGILAFVLDQNIRTESVKVPFFGHPALTPIGPVKFAIRTEAVAAPAFIERGEDGMHHARFGEPIFCEKTDDPVALAARITALIEQQIRSRPEQWVWMHDRWRERPKWEVDPATISPRSRLSSAIQDRR